MLAHVQNVLAKHEMFEEIGGGETSKQGQEVVVASCQANNVGQFRQALTALLIWLGVGLEIIEWCKTWVQAHWETFNRTVAAIISISILF